MSLLPIKFAIIVAGGTGRRMESDVPKQYMKLAGRPMLMHTLEAFYRFSADLKIILVLPADRIPEGTGGQPGEWEALCEQYNFTIPLRVVEGGTERFDSVRNGLLAIPDDGLVAIHDAARPLVTPELIGRSFREASEHGTAVPVIPIQETVRKITHGRATQVDRLDLFLIQTPQVFDIRLLKEAYRQFFRPEFTDDAAVVEAAGHGVHYFQGQKTNIKITFTDDLAWAEKMLQG